MDICDVNLTVEAFALVLIATLLGAQWLQPAHIRRRMGYYFWLLIADLGMLVLQMSAWALLKLGLCDGTSTLFLVLQGAYDLAYGVTVVLLSFYLGDYVADGVRMKHSPAWLAVPFVGVSVIGCWTGMFYSFTADGYVVPTSAYAIGAVLCCLAGTVGVMAVLHRVKSLGLRDSLLLLLIASLPAAAPVVPLLWHSNIVMPLALSLSLVMIRNFIQLEQSERLYRQELLMAQTRFAVARSQIQPHFLYNTLNSIYYLCESDPDAAQQAVGDFAEYLRANLDLLESGGLVPVEKELEHVRHYLALEQMRFGEELNVAYDVRCRNFMLPVLTLQPLVENAVKHGVTRKKGGGTVTIRTYETAAQWFAEICDNGVGFDPAQPMSDDRTHVGIDSVRRRLAAFTRGTLEIRSAPGSGTQVTVSIPKQHRGIRIETEKGMNV